MGRVMMPRRAGEMTVPVPKETGVTVEITGYGGMGYAEAQVGAASYSAPASDLLVQPGDSITLSVRGNNTDYPGTVTINGKSYLHVTEAVYQAMLWTVPEGITSILISLDVGMPYYNGIITVTTN